MKVAAIGDVHANLPALQAVLEHARKHSAEQIWNIGDFVGYGPFPDEVVSLLRSLGAVSIQGNYDRKVLKVPKKIEQWRETKAPEKWLAFQWAYDHLTDPNRTYLGFLAEQQLIETTWGLVLLVHGSPASQNEHLTTSTPIERLRELAAMTSARTIICGHSHQPFTRQVDQTLFINTGSVGRPDDGDPRAAYAFLEFGSEGITVDHFRVYYDVQKVVQAICSQDLPEDFARMLQRGRSLTSVQQAGPDEDHPCQQDRMV